MHKKNHRFCNEHFEHFCSKTPPKPPISADHRHLHSVGDYLEQYAAERSLKVTIFDHSPYSAYSTYSLHSGPGNSPNPLGNALAVFKVLYYKPSRHHNNGKYVSVQKAKDVYGIQKHVPDRFKTTTMLDDKIMLIAGFLDGDGGNVYRSAALGATARARATQVEGIHTPLFEDIVAVAKSIKK